MRRFDRDVFVEVQWDNIEAGMAHNFNKYPRTLAFPKYPYDFMSIMQYPLWAFGINGSSTLILTVFYTLSRVRTIHFG